MGVGEGSVGKGEGVSGGGGGNIWVRKFEEGGGGSFT